MADYSELKRKAQEIRDEVRAGANTANRVGLALEDTVNALEAENMRAEQAEVSLENAVQLLRDETEDLQSMRDTIDRLGTDKADKSALEAINKTVEGKQDTLQTYKEATDKADVKMPNGNSYIRVTKDGAGMYAQDGKSGIVNSSSGSRLVYMETATDASGSSYTSHRDDISIGKHDGNNNATHITMTSKSTTEEAGEKITNTSTIQVNPTGIRMLSPEGEIEDVVKAIKGKADKGESVDIINDLTTGGADKALSAEMGKELGAELATKAPKVGYAPDLKVNFAKELVGRGEATPEVIGSIRPTGVRSIGDGNATIERIKGESVVWNQLEPNYDLSNNALSVSCKNITTINGIVSIEGVNSHYAYIYASRDKIKIYQGHKYLLSIEVRSAEYVPNQMAVYDLTNQKWLIVAVQTYPRSNKWEKISNITTATTNGIGSLLIYPAYNSAIFDTLTDWQGRNFIVQDLTQMFGAGNEPTTIEEFEARKPLGVTNEYNEGTIVSYNGDALKSVGFNAWDEEWEVGKINPLNGANEESTTFKRSANYTKLIKNTKYHCSFTNGTSDSVWIMFFDLDGNPIEHKIGHTQVNNLSNVKNVSFVTPNQDCKVRFYIKNEPDSQVCIHLAHTYNPERYPNGYAPYEADTHPLPDVKSILDADGNQLFPYGLLSAGSVHDEITATKAIKRVGVVDMGTLGWNVTSEYSYLPSSAYGDLISNNSLSVYDIVYSSDSNLPTRNDKYIQCYPPSVFRMRNVQGYNVSQIKELLQGVLLYYELAEPIEVDLEEPLNMTYEAWDFGTEELVAKGATTPLNADIVYQFNAVDRIRENSSAIDVLEEHVEEHKDDGIKLLDNGNLELTLKGETREFMPATPSGDPMHWAYVSAGAEYNATGADITKTGVYGDTIIHKANHWYFNEIGDLSNQEIAEIYSERWPSRSTPIAQYFWGVKSRTACIGLSPSSAISNYLFYHCYNMEKLKLTNDTSNSITLSPTTTASIISLSSLTKILTILKANNTTAFPSWFDGCVALEEVRISALKCDISFKHCSNISKTSVKYMIDNAIPTSAITITLHHDAYERLKGDADILQALTTKNADLANTGDGKGKVSLVCATDNNTIPSE